MSGRFSIPELRWEQGPWATRIRNLIRRFACVSSDGSRWRAEGAEGEQDDFEVFGVAGISVRPKRGTGAECVVVNVGAGTHKVIAATRNREVELTLSHDDEIAICTSGTKIHIRHDGKVEICSKDGKGQPLATKADVDALREFVARHRHEYVTTAGVAGTSTTSQVAARTPLVVDVPPMLTGTRILSAE